MPRKRAPGPFATATGHPTHGWQTLDLEADHRRHAEIENAIRDLKYGVGLNHLPPGRFPANAAWLAVQVLAHNLARWTTRIGLGEPLITTKTLRRRFFSLAGRITRKARRLILHLPPGLALAKPVQQRPGEAARCTAPFLTTPSAFDLPTMTPHAWSISAQAGSRVSPPAICPLITPSPALPAVRNHLCEPVVSRTLPNLSESKPASLLPTPLIPALTSTAASLRWIRAKPTCLMRHRATLDL